MKTMGISASLAAIGTALASMACCLPFGFLAALGAAGAGTFFQKYRFLFLAAATVLLAVGFWQQRRARKCSAKLGATGIALLWTAVVVVLSVIFFPQQIAGFIADWFSGATK